MAAEFSSTGGRRPGISGANQAPLGRAPDPCRHCGKRIDGESYAKHVCDNKTANRFWCEGCAGVIPDVATPEFWILHLHSCPKTQCKRCRAFDHCYLTCPQMKCGFRGCDKAGHLRLLHFYEKNASQEYLALMGEPIKLKMAKSSRERPKGFKRTVHFGEDEVLCDSSTMQTIRLRHRSVPMSRAVQVRSPSTLTRTSTITTAPSASAGTLGMEAQRSQMTLRQLTPSLPLGRTKSPSQSLMTAARSQRQLEASQLQASSTAHSLAVGSCSGRLGAESQAEVIYTAIHGHTGNTEKKGRRVGRLVRSLVGGIL